MPLRSGPPSILAWLALVCAIATPASLGISRWLVSAPDYQPGDDTYFSFMMAAPAFALAGVVLSLTARSRERNMVVAAALGIGALMLVYLVGGMVLFGETYTGR